MKTFLFLSIFTCLFCFNKFEIVEATSQKWQGGRQETGFGTYYELTIVPKANSDKLIFDRLWLDKKYFEISSFQKGKKMKNNLFSKGDTITIRVNDRVVKEQKLFVEKDNCLIEKHEVPYKYEGIALLSYTYKGKRKYKEIKEFLEKEELNYP